jgi:hypothetical protein
MFRPIALLSAMCGAFLAAAPALPAQVTATAAPAATGTTGEGQFEITGGAAYSHFNPGFAHLVKGTNLEGWTAGADYWLGRHIAIEGNVRGLYGNFPIPGNAYGITGTSNISEYVFLFGPSFRIWNRERWQAGMHIDVGGAQGNFSSGYKGSGIEPFLTGVYNDQLAFAAAVGGWAQRSILPQWSVRVVADYQPTHYGGFGQNEFAGTLGVVYRPGRHSR